MDLRNHTIVTKTVEPAAEEEVEGTKKVMGGEDWLDWIKALKVADVLEDNALTVAYSYIGPRLTYPIYYDGTIGQAKRHLEKTARVIREEFPDVRALISVNKALVTQASAAIPIVPLYFAVLYGVMKEAHTHEGCIEQMVRLFREKLLEENPPTDEAGRIRMDDWELEEHIQSRVWEIWEQVTTKKMQKTLPIFKGYWGGFLSYVWVWI